MDGDGKMLGYVAIIYVRLRGQPEPRFLRKTRLPETAEVLAAAIRQHGLQALEAATASRETSTRQHNQFKTATRAR